MTSTYQASPLPTLSTGRQSWSGLCCTCMHRSCSFNDGSQQVMRWNSQSNLLSHPAQL
jgi:hypothetical protein